MTLHNSFLPQRIQVYDKLQTDSQSAFKKMQEKKKQTAERNAAKAMGVTVNSAVDIPASSSSEKLSTTTLLVMLLRYCKPFNLPI